MFVRRRCGLNLNLNTMKMPLHTEFHLCCVFDYKYFGPAVLPERRGG